MTILSIRDFKKGQDIVVADSNDRNTLYRGKVIGVHEERWITALKVEINYKGESVKTLFKNTGTSNYLYQWKSREDSFCGHLFLSEEAYETYINECNRIKIIRDELKAIKSKYEIEKKLKENRVMEVVIPEEKEVYAIREKCDEYFGVSLNKEEFYELSDYFRDIGKLMEKNGH